MRYRERLVVPPLWWVLSGLFAASLLLAFGLSVGPVWGVLSAVVSFAVTSVIFAVSAVEIQVSDRELRVGRAHIELGYLGSATALDAQHARARRGPGADARAYLVLRPYIPTAVEVEVTDADDPVPYWLVASRRPRALCAALNRAGTVEPGLDQPPSAAAGTLR